MKRKSFPAAFPVLAAILGTGIGHGQTIQFSAALPVANQTVTITVPGLGAGGVITCTDSRGGVTQLAANTASQATWTPTRYGKHTVSSGAATQTAWVTVRPMTFHCWSATLAQANVTTVMAGGSDWQARGVTTVAWTGGEAYSRGVDGHWWTQPADWTNGWSYANTAGGMAIDEAYCDAGFPTDQIIQAAAMERQARAANYSISLWSSGFGAGFAAAAAILKANHIAVLLEDYSGSWNLHVSRWAAVRSYGLQDQAMPGIWPGNAPLTTTAAVRADMAWVRLAAPEANGIAIFAPDPALLAATDQAIEDYFLKPLVYLSLPASGQLNVWDLGNDDATAFSLQFLDSSGGVLQSVDLSDVVANGQRLLTMPSGAVNARIINPSDTANLYADNSRYPNGLYPLSVPGPMFGTTTTVTTCGTHPAIGPRPARRPATLIVATSRASTAASPRRWPSPPNPVNHPSTASNSPPPAGPSPATRRRKTFTPTESVPPAAAPTPSISVSRRAMSCPPCSTWTRAIRWS